MAHPSLSRYNFIKKTGKYKSRIANTTRIPLLGSLIDHLVFKRTNITFLPIDKTVASTGSTVVPSDIVRHFIQTAGFRFLMNECICRAGIKCENYPETLGCIFLGESARNINPEIGREVSVEEALEHQEKCEKAGLIQMIGRDQVDDVWMGIDHGNKILTICNCCECCCLWASLPNLKRSIGDRIIHKMEGVDVRINDDCKGCGICEKHCFVDAISVIDDKSHINESCRGCGRCAQNCPENAVEVVITNSDAVNDVIQKITNIVEI